MLQCVAVRRSVLQSVIECCGVLQSVEVCCSAKRAAALTGSSSFRRACCSMLQCVAEFCSVLQCVAALSALSVKFLAEETEETLFFPFAKKPYPPKNGKIALWPSTNGSIDDFLVMAGSQSTITEITTYKLIGLM